MCCSLDYNGSFCPMSQILHVRTNEASFDLKITKECIRPTVVMYYEMQRETKIHPPV